MRQRAEAKHKRKQHKTHSHEAGFRHMHTSLLKYGVIMLTCIPSARGACEHDYSVFQQNVPSMVEMPREYDEWSWVRILREMHARSMARRASGHYMPVKLGNLWLDVGTSTREGTFC
jgi:hypothetical protein